MPLIASLPQNSRYYKSTTLIVRNKTQLNALNSSLPASFSNSEQGKLKNIINDILILIEIFSNPKFQTLETTNNLFKVSEKIKNLSSDLSSDLDEFIPSVEALSQPKWGISNIEIPMLPITKRGVLYENMSLEAKNISNLFIKIRNFSTESKSKINKIKKSIKLFKEHNKKLYFPENISKQRESYIKSIE